MAQPIKNEADILGLISKMQVQLFAIDQKLNTLITRTVPGAKFPTMPVVVTSQATPKTRPMHTAICADCKKECSIPFKPSGDRPVYCQECFSRRKSGNTPINDKSKETIIAPTIAAPIKEVPKPQAKKKKRIAAVKKPVTKKKTAPKKK
jgi:CxxC-x17-CxxC domain-containing protein